MRCLACAAVLLLMLVTALATPALAQDGSSPTTHIVQPGETLFRIAMRYGVTVDALRLANGLTETSVLLSGQALVIPTGAAGVSPQAGARSHRVSQGESLEQIARRYNITLEALLRANNLTAATPLRPGQIVLIPAGSGAADLGLMGVSVLPPPPQPPVTDLGILPAAGSNPAPASASPVPADSPPVSPPVVLPLPTPDPELVTQVSSVPATQETQGDIQPVKPAGPEILPAAIAPISESLAPAPNASDTQLPAAASGSQPAVVVSAPEMEAVAPDDIPSLAQAVNNGTGTAPDKDSVLWVEGETLSAPDLGIIPPDTATWLRQPGLFTTGGPRVREIYERGQALGNNPHAFSKIGDCNSEAPFFLARFDSGDYDLGPYQYLQPVIDYFAGSFERKSVTVWTGNHVWSVLDPTFANPALCLPGETPLACEFRLHRPSVVLIRLGTNEVNTPALFEQHLRAILDYAIEQGVIPILGTKADQLEGSDAINEIIRQLAAEYGVPLWDFGRIASTLPGRGLRDDGFHMTWYPLTFGDPRALQRGHSVHNLTALIALYTVWQSVLR